MGPQLSRELMDAQIGVFVRATPGQTEKSEKNPQTERTEGAHFRVVKTLHKQSEE